jgi:hypothetical protein
MVDPGPLKALSETEEEDYESGPPVSSGHNLGWEKVGLAIVFLFMLLATCRG